MLGAQIIEISEFLPRNPGPERLGQRVGANITNGRLAEGAPGIHEHVRRCEAARIQSCDDSAFVSNRVVESLRGLREHRLTVSDDDELQRAIHTDFVLHGQDELASFDVEERARVSEGVRAELFPQAHDRGPELLNWNLLAAELGEESRFDHLAPGHDILTCRLLTEHRVVEPAGSDIPIQPPTGCAGVETDKSVDIGVRVDRTIEQ